jgi:hypothetical protein
MNWDTCGFITIVCHQPLRVQGQEAEKKQTVVILQSWSTCNRLNSNYLHLLSILETLCSRECLMSLCFWVGWVKIKQMAANASEWICLTVSRCNILFHSPSHLRSWLPLQFCVWTVLPVQFGLQPVTNKMSSTVFLSFSEGETCGALFAC